MKNSFLVYCSVVRDLVVTQQSPNINMVRLLFLVIILAAVGQMTQTMYVPAIPAMSEFFAVESSYLQAVMAAYLIPYGLSQFIYGPLSDRKIPNHAAVFAVFTAKWWMFFHAASVCRTALSENYPHIC